MNKLVSGWGLVLLLLCAGPAQAALIDRSNGLIYDEENDISWTKVAGDGIRRNWNDQMSWAADFSLAGFDDFRLPTIDELVSLYGQLPGTEGSDKMGDISPFKGIQTLYWSSSLHPESPDFVWVQHFRGEEVMIGNWSYQKPNSVYGWAVRDGDSVTAVPEPVSGVLMGLGLGGCGWRGGGGVDDGVRRIMSTSLR